MSLQDKVECVNVKAFGEISDNSEIPTEGKISVKQ